MRFAFFRLSLPAATVFFSVLLVFSSCKITNYQVNKPFVFANRVELGGDIPKDQKNRLTAELENYWDDSLRVRMKKSLGIIYKLDAPPVFDSSNITRTIRYMNAYLNSQGYYYASFRDSVRIDTVKDQLRTTVAMYIEPGKNISIDSVAYDLNDTTLQRLTADQQQNTVLKKGEPYTKQVINKELDRLVDWYRQNGYYYFTRDDVYALVDSIDASLLTLTLDPFKQAQLIAEAARNRRIDPKWDITITRKASVTPEKLTQYHIGKIYFYPETKLSDVPDSLINRTDFTEFRRRELVMKYKKGTFTYHPLRDHSYFRTGDLYDDKKYYKTVNTLNQLGAWQQVNSLAVPRDKDSLDIHFFLVPAIKQSYQLGLETSLNTADIGAGNLVGISGNIEYTNRNVWKRAVQSLTTLRSGVELNLLNTNDRGLAQTFLISLGQTYAFPKLVLPFRTTRRQLGTIDNKRTLLSVNASYVDRRDYYRLRSFVTNWGYEWKKGDLVWIYRPINIELYSIDRLPLLEDLIKKNPFLQTSFNEGRIISQKLSLIKSFVSRNNFNKNQFIRLEAEEAGGLFGFIPGLKNNIYRYIKLEAEYRELVRFRKTELAWRSIVGIGYNYGTDPAIGQTLPFFKQFFGGGPNSMRAWALRQLGLGSSTLSEQDLSPNSYRDRFGDMRFETNVEYRFTIADIGGFKIGSALFADIGNVWNIKSDTLDPKMKFSFQNFYRDLAIGVGTGLRFDLEYFLIRVDFGYKVKDPARPTKNGWMNGLSFTETRPNGLRVNNYAVQLGIGLPF